MGKGTRLDGVRVLVVEDDDDTREVLSLGLGLAGADVVAVPTAREALRAIDRRPPDVLLSDIGLPDEDGLELIREIRRLPAARGRIPAAAVTAFTLSDDADRALRAGFQRHFRKPVETKDLFQAVADLARQGAIERRRSRRGGGGGGRGSRRGSGGSSDDSWPRGSVGFAGGGLQDQPVG